VPGGWIVLNAEKHRRLVTRAVIQEQTRQRVSKHREKKRTSNASVTPSEARAEAGSGSETEEQRTNTQLANTEADASVAAAISRYKKNNPLRRKNHGYRIR
jgi:hypothetical protein